jgi:hypothetical protein
MGSAKSLERRSAQQSGPENSARHFGDVAPIHTCRDCRPNYAAHTGASHDYWFDSDFIKCFDNANVGQATNGASAKS